MYKHILIPTDGSKCSELAIIKGLNLAKALGAKVTFLNAVEDPITTIFWPSQALTYYPEVYAAAKHAGQESLDKASSLAKAAGVEANTILLEKREPSEAILEAEVEADLVIIGTHGRRGVQRFVFGSVAEAVIRRTNKPCLIIRGTDSEASEPETPLIN